MNQKLQDTWKFPFSTSSSWMVSARENRNLKWMIIIYYHPLWMDCLYKPSSYWDIPMAMEPPQKKKTVVQLHIRLNGGDGISHSTLADPSRHKQISPMCSHAFYKMTGWWLSLPPQPEK